MRASAGGKLPANARQIMYAARAHILKRTGRDRLGDQYFTQQVLPNYVFETGVKWDVVYDDRGHFREPHTGRVIGLGTLSVRCYLKNIGEVRFTEPSFNPGSVITCGPQGRFGALLYVEKEGFDSLWAAVRLAERYDIGIMSCKGMSVTAARQMAEEICSTYEIPLYVLHDFEKSGVSIRASFQKNTRRYVFRKKFDVFDLGFRLEDTTGLEPEPHSDRGSPESRASNMRKNGASETEIEFLLDHRVELNAMTSDQLVGFVERKLMEHGIKKIVPSDDELAAAYALRRWNIEAKKVMRRELSKLKEDLAEAKPPLDLRERVDALLHKKPHLSWNQAVFIIASRDRAKGGGA